MSETELNVPAILADLGFDGAESVERVSGGRDAAIFRVERCGTSYALRVFRAGEAEAARREVLAMRAAVAHGLPVPAVLAEALGRDRPALLLSWIPGCPLAQELAARPWRAWPLGVLFGRTLAALHRTVAPEGLRAVGDTWIKWEGPGDATIAETVANKARLLHLDYHLLNVLTDGARITGVLDWTNARAGDPRADFGRTLTILRLDAGPRSFAKSAVLRVFEAGMRRGYRQVAGRLHNLAPYYAWAGAVMLHDRGPRLDRPSAMSPSELARARSWTEHWMKRAAR